MKYLPRVALIGLLAFWPAVTTAFAQDPPQGMGKTLFVEGIDAVVNDEVILAGEVEEVMKAVQQEYGYDFNATGTYEAERRKVLDRMIDELLVYQAGIEKGYGLRKNELEKKVDLKIEELRQRDFIQRQGGLEEFLKKTGRSMEGFRKALTRDTERDYVQRLMIRMNITEKVQVTERELDKMKRENPEFIRERQTVQVRQIFFRCPKAAPEEKVEEVRKRAEQVYLRIKAGEDFKKMASLHSEHLLTQREGGLMPPYRRGELAKPFDSAFDMEIGEVHEPFRTPAGFHILMLEKKPSIEQVVEEQRGKEELAAWLEELRAEALAKGTLIIKGMEPREELSTAGAPEAVDEP